MPGTLSQPAVEEDKKPGDQAGIHINLKVKGQDGNEVFFRIKRNTQLKKVDERLLRSSVFRVQLHCLPVRWAATQGRADSRRGIITSIPTLTKRHGHKKKNWP